MKITIKPTRKSDLKILNKELSHAELPKLHDKKYKEQQTGKSLWLIAWKNKEPIGHVQLRFNGSNEKTVRKKLKKCPHIESLGVKQKYRRKGIAKQLMIFAEELAKKKGFSKTGLSVEDDDKFLKNLYKKMNYNDWKKGKIIESWKINNKKVKKKCVYLVKEMKAPKRILILGTTGSGKTTLAAKLSKILRLPHIGLDWIVFKKHWTTRYSDQTISKKIKQVIKKQKWIMEGVYSSPWMGKIAKRADLVILLNFPRVVLAKRVTQRFLRKKSSEEKSDKISELLQLFQLFKAINNYYKKGFKKGYYRHKEFIDKHKAEFISIKNNKQLNKFLEELK